MAMIDTAVEVEPDVDDTATTLSAAAPPSELQTLRQQLCDAQNQAEVIAREKDAEIRTLQQRMLCMEKEMQELAAAAKKDGGSPTSPPTSISRSAASTSSKRKANEVFHDPQVAQHVATNAPRCDYAGTCSKQLAFTTGSVPSVEGCFPHTLFPQCMCFQLSLNCAQKQKKNIQKGNDIF